MLPRRSDDAEMDPAIVGRRGLFLLPSTILVLALVETCNCASGRDSGSGLVRRRVVPPRLSVFCSTQQKRH